MRQCLTTQAFRVLFGFLLLPVISWGKVVEEASLFSLSQPDTESAYHFDLLASEEGVTAYEHSEEPALSPVETSLSLDIPGTTDWVGLTKDTAYFLGYQFSIIGVLYVMPSSISGWTKETKREFSMQQYTDNASQVVWDKDLWFINYVLHPYWGGTYFVRGQQRGLSPMGSFLYAATLSSMYEFGAEAFFEEPSIQDLIVTPGAGYFVGQYFMTVRNHIQKKSAVQLSGTDKFILAMTDPIGAMNEKVESWFSRKVKVSLLPMLGPQFRKSIVNETRFEETNRWSYMGVSDIGMKMTVWW
ncbi:MAG: DUF3943 domain-containing protein [Gammaproteobacteria bacterium]|nr:DUF3943 domain-containing protein [Gammaproteobacteria bacterium]